MKNLSRLGSLGSLVLVSLFQLTACGSGSGGSGDPSGANGGNGSQGGQGGTSGTATDGTGGGGSDGTSSGGNGATNGGTNGSNNGSTSTVPTGPCEYSPGVTKLANKSPHPARLYLTDGVLARLQARASSKDPAWTALQNHCEGLTTGTFNTPKQNAYPDYPNVGQGYQGDGYLPEIMDLGLCYRVTEGIDAAAAARYGAAGARLLETMATPVSSGGEAPSTDSGYGIRNYGVGMATGYDWLYPALSSATKQTVMSSLENWIDWYDQSGFLHNYPISNYFAGYALAKASTAIALDGDDAKATTYWNDVDTRIWGQLIKPIYTTSMSGGGWPEGWGYGPRSVQEIVQFLWATETGKGKDYWKQIPQGVDQARYLTHFAWPSLRHMSDEGSVHAQDALRPSTVTATSLAMMLEYHCDAYAPTARSFAADLIATNGGVGEPWQAFLMWDPSLPTKPYSQNPLSYFAKGPSHVSMRSSWDKNAVLGHLVGGTYIDSPDSGEQSFDAGNLVIVQGDQPIVVNPTGWLAEAAGQDGEAYAYADSYSGSQPRMLMNGFFAAGAHQVSNTPGDAQTHVERFEDGGSFVRAHDVLLEQMYTGPVAQWTRDVAFVRPGAFVVYDRTTTKGTGVDQGISWHVTSNPTAGGTADSTQRRYDVTANGATVGSVRTLLPQNPTMSVVSTVDNAVFRIETHAPDSATAHDWLTVVTAGASVPESTRLSSQDGNVTSGNAVGANVLGARNAVVLFNADHGGNATNSSLTYVVRPTATADHVLFDMAPSSNGYAITTTTAGNAVTVHVQQGGSHQVSSNGTLSFAMASNGTIQ